jgi:hypothetical protein
MPKYNYTCTNCNSDYSETRLTTDPLFFDKCSCGANFVFVNEEPA